MVYNNKFVVVIKVNGKILREQNGEVYIPFGAEYSIALKNLNSVKATAKISVDGTNVLSGHEIIIEPSSETELEGFMRGNRVSNKFKFIAKTKAISEYRGNKISDGLVRVAFKFERQIPNWYPPIIWNISPNYYLPERTYGPTYGPTSDTPFSGGVVGSSADPISPSLLGNSACFSVSHSVNTEGITVKGNKSSQKFVQGSVGLLEATEHVIILQLKGEVKTKPVIAPVTIRSKVTCETCGKVSKSFSKFCSRCGTALF